MKAAVIQNGALEIWDVPVPKPGPYEVLCRMEYGSTCAGTDLRLMAGGHPNPISYPTILGHESVGRVVEAGSRVRNFHVGDLVSRVGAPAGLVDGLSASWGGFAEYGVAKDHWEMIRDGVPQSEWNRSRVNQIIPPQIDARQAPMIITWRETLSYTQRLGIRPGDTVLIVGSGANALALAVHACNLGAKVCAVGSLSRREVFLRYPVLAYLDYKSERLSEQLQDAGVQAADFIVDGIGSSGTVNDLLPLLREGGCVGIYGWNDRAHAGVNPFRAKASFRVYCGGYDEEETHHDVVSLILRGRLRAEDWYDLSHPVALADIAQAYESLRRHEALKYLIQL